MSSTNNADRQYASASVVQAPEKPTSWLGKIFGHHNNSQSSTNASAVETVRSDRRPNSIVADASPHRTGSLSHSPHAVDRQHRSSTMQSSTSSHTGTTASGATSSFTKIPKKAPREPGYSIDGTKKVVDVNGNSVILYDPKNDWDKTQILARNNKKHQPEVMTTPASDTYMKTPGNTPMLPNGAASGVVIPTRYRSEGGDYVGYVRYVHDSKSETVIPKTSQPLTDLEKAVKMFPEIGREGPENLLFVAKFKEQGSDPTKAMAIAETAVAMCGKSIKRFPGWQESVKVACKEIGVAGTPENKAFVASFNAKGDPMLALQAARSAATTSSTA